MRAAGALLLVVMAGCAPGDPAVDDAVFCADAPVTTWDNFGAGFVTENCRSCHMSASADRQEAPEDTNFDDEAATLEWADRILARAAGAEPSMPPEGGTDGDDRYLLEVWLRCAGEPVTPGR